MSSETVKAEWASLSWARFRFSVKVNSLMALPSYKGAVFRGAFGSTFRRVVCAVPRGECGGCMVRRQCIYAAFFEPSPPPGYPDAARFNMAPPPYVLNPPMTRRQVFNAGDLLDFEVVLIGHAIEALPYFIYTFMELGRKGLGRERGKYELLRVDLLRGEESIHLFDGCTRSLSGDFFGESVMSHPEDGSVREATLDFLTPLRLKLKDDLVTHLTFPVLFERLAQRIALLSAFYGSDGSPPDVSHLAAQAREIRVSADELHWYDWERYSSRQKASMKLGGLRGRIRFVGGLGPFMPYLRMGQSLNVGQGTTFGLGRFRLIVDRGDGGGELYTASG